MEAWMDWLRWWVWAPGHAAKTTHARHTTHTRHAHAGHTAHAAHAAALLLFITTCTLQRKAHDKSTSNPLFWPFAWSESSHLVPQNLPPPTKKTLPSPKNFWRHLRQMIPAAWTMAAPPVTSWLFGFNHREQQTHITKNWNDIWYMMLHWIYLPGMQSSPPGSWNIFFTGGSQPKPSFATMAWVGDRSKSLISHTHTQTNCQGSDPSSPASTQPCLKFWWKNWFVTETCRN